MSEYSYFKEDYITNDFNPNDLQYIDKSIDLILEGSKQDEESDSGLMCSFDVEKIDALNETFHINFYDGTGDIDINLSFYTGIDVGCELIDYSFDGTSHMDKPKYHNELVDIEIDFDKYQKPITSPFKSKLEIYLANNKEDIIKLYSNMSYDNYATGGGTTSTNKYYTDKFDKYKSDGFYFKPIYKRVEVDRNIK